MRKVLLPVEALNCRGRGTLRVDCIPVEIGGLPAESMAMGNLIAGESGKKMNG